MALLPPGVCSCEMGKNNLSVQRLLRNSSKARGVQGLGHKGPKGENKELDLEATDQSSNIRSAVDF